MNSRSFLGLAIKFITIYFIYSIGMFIFYNYHLFSIDYFDYNDNSEYNEMMIFFIFNNIRSAITNGLIYFLIAIFFTQKYRLTSVKDASLGSTIGVIYCILLFLFSKFAIPLIYPFLDRLYPDDRTMWGISFMLLIMLSNILLLLLVFKLFKPRSNTTPSESQFSKQSVQKVHATILSCFILLFMLLPMKFIDIYQYFKLLPEQYDLINLFATKFVMYSILAGYFFINLIVTYKIVSISTRSCFNGVIDKIRWGSLFTAMVIALVIMALISYFISLFAIPLITDLTTRSEILIALLIGLFVGYLILGISCRLAVKILFRDSLPPSSGIVS